MNYSCLDLDIIKEQIANYAAISKSKDYILNEEVSFNPLVIKDNINKTSQALSILKDNNVVSFDGIIDITPYLEKANKSIVLEGYELLHLLTFHNHCCRLKKQFTHFDSNLELRDYTDSLTIDNNIFNQIEKCIDPSGNVKEDASIELKRICNEINQLSKELDSKIHSFLSKYSSSLQEDAFYERDGRITFLIKNSDKNKFDGYAYGTSSSGLASYIEPGIFVDINNRKISLLEAKAKEIDRVLTNLTYCIASISDEYLHNFESLMILNVIFAKASYGFYKNGVVGSLNSNYEFTINDLCHPLIDEKKVVSNTYRLFSPYRGIVISGSNTGGKTVSLKAIGLSILMTYLGIPVIASKCEVPLYDNIFVDIDDNQSIIDSLSTFSAHITNINAILSNATNKSLILIDELISGTDPKQAQAISLAILDKIKTINSSFIITTHFDDIKNYAYKDENILLSSVGFNMETLSPTYHYLENSIGSSNAIEIASRYISDRSIIESAKNYLKLNVTKEEDLINQLSKEIEENRVNNEKLNSLILENNSLNNQLSQKMSEINKIKSSIKEDYAEELRQQIDEIIVKVNNQIQDNLNNSKLINKNNLKGLIEDFIEEETEDNSITINVGDSVRINDNEQIGDVLDIVNDKAVVNVNGLKIKTNINNLTLMPKIQKKTVYKEKQKYSRIPMELNIVGQRVDDGLVILDDYIDKALAANMSNVKIIHGFGTGALRNAVRTHLKNHKLIKNIKDGDPYDGGSAVTIVEFKK